MVASALHTSPPVLVQCSFGGKDRYHSDTPACIFLRYQAKKIQDRMQREGVVDMAAQQQFGAKGANMKKDIYAKLSNREIEFYREVFEKIDADGSGEIDDQEVLLAIHPFTCFVPVNLLCVWSLLPTSQSLTSSLRSHEGWCCA